MIDPPKRKRGNPVLYGAPIGGFPSFTEKFSGLDLSLTSTGDATIRYGQMRHGCIKPQTKKRGAHRLASLRDQLENNFSGLLPTLLAIEGYSMGSRGRLANIGEWGGVARLLLHDMGVSYIEVTPNELKQFATGKGNSPKPAVIAALKERWGLDIPQDDEADAAVLALIAACVWTDEHIEIDDEQKGLILNLRKRHGLEPVQPVALFS